MTGLVIFSTGSLYPFGLDRIYGWAAEAGFDGIEIMIDERWYTHQDSYLNHLRERSTASRSSPSICPSTAPLGGSAPVRPSCAPPGYPAGLKPPFSSSTRHRQGGR